MCVCVPRYYYPFPPVGPMLYHMELSIGGQQFIGKGRTRQLAKHEAAAKALKVLHKEPILQQLPVVRKEAQPQHEIVLDRLCTILFRLTAFLSLIYSLLLTDEWRARGGEPQQIRNQSSV